MFQIVQVDGNLPRIDILVYSPKRRKMLILKVANVFKSSSKLDYFIEVFVQLLNDKDLSNFQPTPVIYVGNVDIMRYNKREN